MSATFYHPSGSVTFSRNPQRPDQSLDIIQPQRKSAGGTRFGFAHTIVKRIIKVNFRLTDTEKAALINFFHNVVKGKSGLFVYSDPAGIGYQVRFESDTLAITEKAYSAHSAAIELRISGGVIDWPSGFTLLWASGDSVIGGY